MVVQKPCLTNPYGILTYILVDLCGECRWLNIPVPWIRHGNQSTGKKTQIPFSHLKQLMHGVNHLCQDWCRPGWKTGSTSVGNGKFTRRLGMENIVKVPGWLWILKVSQYVQTPPEKVFYSRYLDVQGMIQGKTDSHKTESKAIFRFEAITAKMLIYYNTYFLFIKIYS